MKKGNLSSLLPIAVFLVFYLGLGIYSEYILKIPMGFYNIPIVVAFLAAILTACLQNREVSFDQKLEQMAQGIGDKNIITMLLIFLAAGTFVGVVGRSSAESVAYFMLSNMGSGTSGMFETCMVAILVAAMCALIRENGGFDVLLHLIHRIFRGKKGGQLGIGLLVGLLDFATANNTVAIVMANPIAKEMSEDYGISPRKTASLLDTFSCIAQGILPYGAQMLVAISALHELGYELSAFEIMANLFYPGMLLISSLIFIFLLPEKTL